MVGSKFHTGGAQTSGVRVKKLVAMAISLPGFVQPLYKEQSAY
jgi:hypothetical protein